MKLIGIEHFENKNGNGDFFKVFATTRSYNPKAKEGKGESVFYNYSPKRGMSFPIISAENMQKCIDDGVKIGCEVRIDWNPNTKRQEMSVVKTESLSDKDF